MSESTVTVRGNVTADPQVKHGKESGVPFTVFGMAENRSRRDANGDIIHLGTSFFEVIAFRALGHNAAESLGKGDPVVVHGRLQINDWESGERSGTTAQIDAFTIGPDLTFGTSVFTKRRRAAPTSQDRVSVEVGGVPVTVTSDGEIVDEAPSQDSQDSPGARMAS
ncbi:MAG: single-stranded DNA-binding protein [Ornithinimicrobium sp.]